MLILESRSRRSDGSTIEAEGAAVFNVLADADDSTTSGITDDAETALEAALDSDIENELSQIMDLLTDEGNSF